MLVNFLKTTLRNLFKNRTYVIINIIGLGLSLSCCVVAYLNFQYTAQFDSNHKNHNNIYKIQTNKVIQGNNSPFGITPMALGEAFEDNLAGVSHTSRYTGTGLVLRKGEKIISKEIGFADKDFFEMFTFPFKHGSPEAFLKKGNIILTTSTSQVYFGDQNPIGQLIDLIGDDGNLHTYQVGGVLEDIPKNTSIRFHGILPMEDYAKIYVAQTNDWKRFVAGTFIMTNENKEVADVRDLLNQKYIAIQNEARDDWKVGSYYLEQLTTLGVNAQNVRSNWLNQPPPPPAVVVPVFMAALMLLIACFNFTNTSLAISSKRLKEIGVRKVMGGNRRQLVLQFMGENLVLCLFALVIGILLSIYLVPAYSAMWPFLDIQLSLTDDLEIYFFLITLLVLTSILAGAYPALYVSNHEPVAILRGSLKLGGSNLFSKLLLATQYTFTVIALISSLAFAANAKYQQSLEVGFKKEGVLAVRVDNSSEYQKLRDRLEQSSLVTGLAGTEHHIGRWVYSRVLRHGEKELEADMMNMGLEYLDLMELKLEEGRFFQEDLFENDARGTLLVNRKMVEQFGWEEPLGQLLQVDDSTRLKVIGVVEDFYSNGFWEPIEPLGIRLAQEESMNFLVVSANHRNSLEVKAEIEKTWYDVVPNKPFSAQFQDTFMEGSKMVNNNIVIMFTFLGVLALILSSIGLFTLVSLNVLRRIKEIGIRKVLGAKVFTIINLLNQPFMVILMISALLGSVLSYFAIDALLSSIFFYYQTLTVISIIVPLLVLFGISLATSSGRVLVAAKRNPVDSLRYE